MPEEFGPPLSPGVDLPLPPPPLVEEIPGGLHISMHAERAGCVIVFLATWLLAWAVGEYFVARDLLAASGGIAEVILLLVWLAGWTAFGVATAGTLAFMLGGREILTIDGNGILRRIEAFGVGRTWQ